jgi:hypothetical protein
MNYSRMCVDLHLLILQNGEQLSEMFVVGVCDLIKKYVHCSTGLNNCNILQGTLLFL